MILKPLSLQFGSSLPLKVMTASGCPRPIAHALVFGEPILLDKSTGVFALEELGQVVVVDKDGQMVEE